ELAQGLYRAAWEIGVNIPGELSVVGFDNAPLAGHMLPGLTSVAQPVEQMAQDAVMALIEMVDGNEASSKTYETSLVVRGSTAPPSR
ncbi:MAG: substrate-binding domain-containing protein, partial [bacterium]